MALATSACAASASGNRSPHISARAGQHMTVDSCGSHSAGHRLIVRCRPAGSTVERHDGAVQLGPPIAEQTPGGTLASEQFAIERPHEDGVVVTTGLGDLLPGVVGDERRTVERDLAGLADLAAVPVRGDDAASGSRRRVPASPAASGRSSPTSGPVVRSRWRSGTGAPRHRAAPSIGPTRGTTDPSRCRRRSCHGRSPRRGSPCHRARSSTSRCSRDRRGCGSCDTCRAWIRRHRRRPRC